MYDTPNKKLTKLLILPFQTFQKKLIGRKHVSSPFTGRLVAVWAAVNLKSLRLVLEGLPSYQATYIVTQDNIGVICGV